MNGSGIIEVAGESSVLDTVEHLEQLLMERGIRIFAKIDHAAEAKACGLTLRPTVVLIFGEPKTGAPLMAQHPTLALDLPLKVLIWETDSGQVLLSYNSPEFLKCRHGLKLSPFPALARIVELAARSTPPDLGSA